VTLTESALPDTLVNASSSGPVKVRVPASRVAAIEPAFQACSVSIHRQPPPRYVVSSPASKVSEPLNLPKG